MAGSGWQLMIEGVTDDTGSSLADLAAPEMALLLTDTAQQEKPSQNLGRHRDEEGPLTRLLAPPYGPKVEALIKMLAR